MSIRIDTIRKWATKDETHRENVVSQGDTKRISRTAGELYIVITVRRAPRLRVKPQCVGAPVSHMPELYI
jgi:hypothetical protein